MSEFTSSGGFRPRAHRGAAALFFLAATGTYQASADSNDTFYGRYIENGAAKDRHRGGGFSFTGPAEFYADGRMTCHRAGAVRELVTLDAFTTNPVGVRRLR